MKQNPTPLLLSKVMDLLLDVVCVVDAEGHFVFVSAASEKVFGYRPDELTGRNMIEFVHPDDRERTLSTAAEVMRDGSRPHFENRYLHKDGQVVDIMWSARWSAQDKLRLAVARDVSQVRRAERKQRALYEIAEAVHTSESLPALYQRMHAIVRTLLPAEDFSVALYDSDTDSVSFPYLAGAHQPLLTPQPLAAGSPLAEVVRSGQAVLINETPSSQLDDGDWLGVPLTTLNGVMGVLVMQNRSLAVRYSEQDKELLHFISTQVADAITRKESEARLHWLALHDGLTGLPNRTLFNDRLDTALKQVRRSGEHLAVLYLDLNGFKQINDTHGHGVGDHLLREIARRLARCLRDSDTIGRMGGDEFTALLTNISDAEQVAEVMRKLSASLGEPFRIQGRALSVSASMGSAIYPQHGRTREALIRSADARMFAAKQGSEDQPHGGDDSERP